jgi:hypothetical protein
MAATDSDPSQGRVSGRAPSSAAPQNSRAVELRIAASAVRFVAVLAVPLLGAGWLAAGRGGLLGAGIAVALVAGMFAMSASLLSFAARLGPSALMAAALGGFALRLMIYALLIVLLRPVEAIHGPTLAVSAAVLLVATLTWEARYVSRTPGFFWVDASTPAPGDPERTRA